MARLNVIVVTASDGQIPTMVVMENVLSIERIEVHTHSDHYDDRSLITFVDGSTIETFENFDTLYDALHN